MIHSSFPRLRKIIYLIVFVSLVFLTWRFLYLSFCGSHNEGFTFCEISQNIYDQTLSKYRFLKSSIPSSTPKQNHIDLTENWKTYINQEFKFSFRYPKEWIIETSEKTIHLKDEKNINKLYVFPDLDLSVIGMSFCAIVPDSEQCEILKVDGKQIDITWSENGGSSLFSKDGNKAVSLTLLNATEVEKSIFRQILSTFRFLDGENPWDSSVCGNGICEQCENECCNYECIGEACSPPNCLGYCPQDCKN